MQSQHQYSCVEATAVTPVPHPLKLPDSAWSHKRCMQRRQRCSDLPSPVCPKNPQHLRAPSSCWHYHADLTRLAPIAHEGFGHKHGGAKKHITKAKPRAWLGQLPAHHPRAPDPPWAPLDEQRPPAGAPPAQLGTGSHSRGSTGRGPVGTSGYRGARGAQNPSESAPAGLQQDPALRDPPAPAGCSPGLDP